MKLDSMSLQEVIKNRRSLYPNNYSEVKVPQVVIEEMLENANWAPTHGLTEPWRFVVFSEEGLQKLARFQSELYKRVSTENGSFDEKKFDKLATNPLKASHVIAIGMKRDPRGKIREIEEVEAVACAVQNMYLTATAHRVGAYWGSGGVTYMEEAKSFFGLEPEDKLLGFFYVGMPKVPWPKGRRGSIEEKVTWVSEND